MPIPRTGIDVVPRDDEQTYVAMGFPALGSNDPGRFAQRAMSALLGMGTSSRLFQEIREKEGLVYSIYSSASSYTDCGALGIYYCTSVKYQEKVARMIAREIARLKKDGLEKEELARAKRLIKGIYVRKLESSESRMYRLGEMFMSTGEVLSSEEVLARMDMVSEEEVQHICDELLNRSSLVMTIHGPKKESEKAAKELEDLDL